MKNAVIILLLATVVYCQQSNEPGFSDYRVKVAHNRVAPLNLQSHPLARKFRTRLREQLKSEGINFAGHYTIAVAGCGTGCSFTAIIDTLSGDAYFPSELSGWTGIVGDYEIPEGQDIRMFEPNSRLLRMIGRPSIGKKPDEERYGPSGIYYYEWVKNKLKLIKVTHVGSYPDSDPSN